MSRSASAAKAISAADAKRLFADFKSTPALVLAVSGGPDSVALMWLAARWRAALKQGPRLLAITVDHRLRTASAREARDVKRLATSLGIEHRTVVWRGAKPKAGLPAAARDARYDLLAKAARRIGAVHIVTAHTRDDQAETVLMRLSRGSGIAGLAGMARQSARDDILLMRPLLDVPKEQLVATLQKAKIDFATDPTNHDLAYTRPRLRALMPALAAEGADARNLTRLAARLARANAALDQMAEGAQRYLAQLDPLNGQDGFDLAAFSALPAEIRIRLLLRAIDRAGHEGPAELGKVETLVQALDSAVGPKSAGRSGRLFKQSLAGAIVSAERGRIRIVPAPPRHRRRT